MTRAPRAGALKRPRRKPPAKRVMRRSEVQSILSCTEYQPANSEAAAFGGVVHDAIARYLLRCRATGEESRLADVLACAKGAFYDQATGVDSNRFDEALGLLDTFARTHLADLHTLMAVEVTLTHDTPSILFTGTLDRLDRLDDGDPDDPPTVVGVRDWKTAQAVDDYAFQCRFYGALVCHTWPTVQTVQTAVDFIRRNAVVEAEYTRAELLEFWQDTMYALDRRLRAKTGVPTGGAACQYCRRARECPAACPPSHFTPRTEEEARALFSELVRLDSARKQTTTALRGYLKHRDRLVHDGLEVGWLEPKTARWVASEKLGIVTYLNGKGLDGNAALYTAIDVSKVPPYLRPELVNAGLARYETGKPTFKYRKAKGEDEGTDTDTDEEVA